MRRNRRKRKQFWLAVECLFAVAFLALICAIGARIVHDQRIAREEASAREVMNRVNATVEPTVSAASEVPAPSPDPEDDLMQSLKQRNPDFVGLLSYGEDTALYVCQGEDNFYYMSHRFDGSEDSAGMIYMDCNDRLDPPSENLILYGHNMRDGSRFGKLKRYEDVNYLMEHPVIRLTTAAGTVDYAPFAILHTSVDVSDERYLDFDRCDFAGKDEFDQYIAQLRAAAMYPLPLEVNYGDRLLTLVTCTNDYDNARLLVVCRSAGSAR